MAWRSWTVLVVFSLGLVRCASIDIEPNQWVLLKRDEVGARRFSSFRFVEQGGYFLQWGFLGHITEYYGNPEEPLEDPPEYDLVYFDPVKGLWQNHLPFEKQDEWSLRLPPLHQCSSYQGITSGSHRPQLKEREGVVRPDLNIVFDQLAYDSRRHRMVYFSGGRTLAYDTVHRQWSDISSELLPPPVSGGSLAYDRGSDQMVLFGGGHVAEGASSAELAGYTGTWMMSCSSGQWRRVDTSLEPPPRMITRLVSDASSGLMYLFGGDGQSHYLGDTWKFDVAAEKWTESTAEEAPPARAGHFTLFDPASRWVIIGGGYNREDLADMWAYDPREDRWMQLDSEVPSGWYVTADLDPEEDLILLTASAKPEGDQMTCNEIYSVRSTFVFRLYAADIVLDTGAPAVQKALAKRAPEDAETGSRPDPARRAAQLRRLQEMPENQWILLADPGRTAPLRTWGSCSFDTRRGRIIYWGGGHCGYGGNDYDFYSVEDNTWASSPLMPEYPERAWDGGVNPMGVTFSGAPWIRHGRKIYAYDPVSDRVINLMRVLLTSGYDPPALRDYPMAPEAIGDGGEYLRSSYTKWVTWVFDMEREQWDLLCPGIPGLELTVTTLRGVIAMDTNWAGLDTGNVQRDIPFDELPQKENAVYLLDVKGEAWKKLSGAGPWPQNLYEMTSLVYDSRREQLILHGAGPARTDVWTFPLKGGRWVKRSSSSGAAPPACNREAVYLPSQDVVLMTGAPPGNRDQAAVYAYEVGRDRWVKTAITPPPELGIRAFTQQNRSITYDPEHDLVLMVLSEGQGDLANTAVYALRYRHRSASR